MTRRWACLLMAALLQWGLPLQAQDDAWWTRLNDPLLTELVGELAGHNPDWKAMDHRVSQATHLAQVPRALQWPSLELTGSVSRTNLRFFPLTEATYGQIGAQVRWEWDFFGRRANDIKAADANVSQQVAARKGVQSQLVADMALAVINWRDTSRRLHHMRLELAARETQASMAQSLHQAGLADPAKWHQVAIMVTQLRTHLAQLESDAATATYHLIQLTGRTDTPSWIDTPEGEDVPLVSLITEKESPLTVLAGRSDIQQARAAMLGANAQLGSIEAQTWPAVSVGGYAGSFQMMDTGNHMTGWSASMDVTYPLFTFWRLSNQVNAAHEGEKVAVLAYESTVKKAVRDSMIAFKQLVAAEKMAQQSQAMLKEQGDILRLHSMRFSSGLIDFGTLCDTQAVYHAFKGMAIRQQSELSRAFVRYHREMGH